MGTRTRGKRGARAREKTGSIYQRGAGGQSHGGRGGNRRFGIGRGKARGAVDRYLATGLCPPGGKRVETVPRNATLGCLGVSGIFQFGHGGGTGLGSNTRLFDGPWFTDIEGPRERGILPRAWLAPWGQVQGMGQVGRGTRHGGRAEKFSPGQFPGKGTLAPRLARKMAGGPQEELWGGGTGGSKRKPPTGGFWPANKRHWTRWGKKKTSGQAIAGSMMSGNKPGAEFQA